MKKFRVGVYLEFIIDAEDEKEARNKAGEIKMPDGYVGESFDIDFLREEE